MDVGALQQVLMNLEVVRVDENRTFSLSKTTDAQVLDIESREWHDLEMKHGDETYPLFSFENVKGLQDTLTAALRDCCLKENEAGFFVTLFLDIAKKRFALVRGTRKDDPSEMSLIEV